MNLKELKVISENINLEDYLDYQNIVKSNMDNPSYLGDFTKNDLENLLNNDSKIWIFFKNNIWICSMMIIPANEEDIIKFELDLEYNKCIDYGPMFVNPKFIGNKLQLQMLKYLDTYCNNLGYEFAISTIHPDNIYSMKNLYDDGFVFYKQKEFKRGIRNIYYKKL